MRGVETAGKKKDELAGVFDELRRGINNVPALLQPDPETDLQNMHLHRYEICPSEPLHDIKGHLSNVFEETMQQATEWGSSNKVCKHLLNSPWKGHTTTLADIDLFLQQKWEDCCANNIALPVCASLFFRWFLTPSH